MDTTLPNLPEPERREYTYLENPSDTLTMVATLRIPHNPAQTHCIPPGLRLPLVGSRVYWNLWALRWREPILSDRGKWVN